MAQVAGSGYDPNSLSDLIQKAQDQSNAENSLPQNQLTPNQQIAKQGGDLGAGAAMGSLGMAPGSLAEMIAAKEAQAAAPAAKSATSTALSNLASNGAAPALEQSAANAIDNTPTLVRGPSPATNGGVQNIPSSQYGNIKVIPTAADAEAQAFKEAAQGQPSFFDRIRSQANGTNPAASSSELQQLQNTSQLQQQARAIRQQNLLQQQLAERKDIPFQQIKRTFGK